MKCPRSIGSIGAGKFIWSEQRLAAHNVPAVGGADDNPDGEIDGVSPQSKFLEFLDHLTLLHLKAVFGCVDQKAFARILCDAARPATTAQIAGQGSRRP